MTPIEMQFPKGFLWGTATAAHQVEGQNDNNNWSAWEKERGRIKDGHVAGKACDWWGGRWQEDFQRAKETHQNAHRLSLEWSRIQPSPQRFDDAVLKTYLEMIKGAKAAGLRPMVTLHHFTDPLWLTERGGWENPDAPSLFASFVAVVVEALKDEVDLWCTLNEPNIYAVSGYALGDFPPGRKDIGATFRVCTHLLRAHSAAYRVIHSKQPHARVGIAVNYRSFLPKNPASPLDRLVARIQHQSFNALFPSAIHQGVMRTLPLSTKVPDAKGTQDFLGINYYTRDYVTFSASRYQELFALRAYRPEALLSETSFLALEPDGLLEALTWGKEFGVPLIVTENGVEDSKDVLRPRYLVEHVAKVHTALARGIPVEGYFHWSLVDNFEWERGWTQRFGLWGLDLETQARIRNKSVDVYQRICQENGISKSMLEQYLPELLPLLFP